MSRTRTKSLAPWIAAPIVLIGWLTVGPVSAQPPEYEKFFGEYVGEAVTGEGPVEKRDIQAKIAAHKLGFKVTWLMDIHRASGKSKHVEYSMTFFPAGRKSVYSAAMNTDAFGNPVPLNPMKGDPYVWARIDGQNLTLYALTVTDNGGYDMQVYDRKLVPGGMELRYSRILDGQIQRTVTGKLKKVR